MSGEHSLIIDSSDQDITITADKHLSDGAWHSSLHHPQAMLQPEWQKRMRMRKRCEQQKIHCFQTPIGSGIEGQKLEVEVEVAAKNSTLPDGSLCSTCFRCPFPYILCRC